MGYSGGLDTLVRTVSDWCFIGGSRGFSMCFIFLKSKCLNIKLKCCVGDPDRYWNIGRKRYCALYLSIGCIGVHGCSKENFCLICWRKSLISLGGCEELWRVSMLIWYGSYLCYMAVVYSIRIGVQSESVIVFCLRSGLWKKAIKEEMRGISG